MSTLLNVEGLTKYFETNAGTVHSVEGVSFSVERGETFGLVEESGSIRTIIQFHDSQALTLTETHSYSCWLGVKA